VLGERRSGSLASHQDDPHFSIGELVAEALLEYLNAVNDADHIRAEFGPEGTEFGVGPKGFSDGNLDTARKVGKTPRCADHAGFFGVWNLRY
jgi:hypothetical protein